MCNYKYRITLWNFIPNITHIYISLPITYKINLVQYCKTERHRVSVPCNSMLFFAKKQNRTLGIVKYTIFLIYEEFFNRRVFYSWNNTFSVYYVLQFSATSLGIKSCQVFVWSICNLTKMCATFYCLPYYDPSHLGWASRIIYAVNIQYNIHAYYKYTIYICILFRCDMYGLLQE